MKALLIIVPLMAIACVLLASCGTSSHYTTAPFTVVRSEGPFEIRDYPALAVASTPRGGDNESFKRLFGYISGANASKQKISMTTPVLMTGDEMRFVMPAPLQTTAPQPANNQVKLQTLPPRRFGVYRYSGRAIPANERTALTKLTQWLDAAQIQHGKESAVAYYDPPWTLPPLRHNEVLLPLK